MLKIYLKYFHKDRLLSKTRPPIWMKGVFCLKISGKILEKGVLF